VASHLLAASPALDRVSRELFGTLRMLGNPRFAELATAAAAVRSP